MPEATKRRAGWWGWLRQRLARQESERAGSAQVQAEYLRVIYRNLAFSSPISFAMVLYLIAQAEPLTDDQLLTWGLVFNTYLLARWIASLLYPGKLEPTPARVRLWSAISVLIQASNGVLIAYLALFVLPLLDLYAQIVAVMVVLILVGATAFSLSGRWIDTLVYAPPIYLSFAWTISKQDHPYAQGVSLLTLALFALHLVYASSHRRSILQGFALARRSADLARELQFKNIEFQELASARSRLLATVSHDLRQPAHAIGLLSEQALAAGSFDAVKSTLRDLNDLSQSLSASLTTLMDLTRLDAGLVQARIVAVPLQQVMRRLDAEYGASARAKGLGLSFGPSEQWVLSDPVLLQALLGNLISNAIKYTQQGQVDVTVVELESSVQVKVVDTGIGIAPDKLDLIFREFVRLDVSEAGAEGLGLGLSIVRRYAQLLSHQLGVESLPTRGSTFSVRLPRAQAPAAALDPAPVPLQGAISGPQAGHEEAVLAGAHVLVIENVELLLNSLTRTLAGWGCQVRSARNMREAIQEARAQWPDLVVSDHHLGDREPNGIELIQALRQQGQREGRPALRALLMTGDVSAQLESLAHDSGVRVLHKPVRPQLLRASLVELVASPAGSLGSPPG